MVPILGHEERDAGYATLDEALAHGWAQITEMSEAGQVPVLKVVVTGDVPVSRGLGSSVTVRLGITAGLNELFGKPLSRDQLLELVTRLEGHPDNAAPALLGGFVASGKIGERVRTHRVSVAAALKFVAVIPHMEIETEKARKILPKRVALARAVLNLNRACSAMCTPESGTVSPESYYGELGSIRVFLHGMREATWAASTTQAAAKTGWEEHPSMASGASIIQGKGG
jgi:homoserine kinase